MRAELHWQQEAGEYEEDAEAPGDEQLKEEE